MILSEMYYFSEQIFGFLAVTQLCYFSSVMMSSANSDWC